MRKLRPGVARAWKKIQFLQRVNAAFAKVLPTLIGNFYAETPVQKALRGWRDRCAMPNFKQAVESLEGQENVHTDGKIG